MANDPAASAALEYRKRKAESVKGTIEHREFGIGGLEVRELDDGTLRMTGYGSVTEVEYPIGRSFTEVIKRGAFKRTLSENPDTVLLYGHEGMPLARTKTGTLVMEEDAKGLKWTADLDAEDPESRVLARKVDKGLIDQCSFAFLVTGETWSENWDHRSITSVSIHRGDISLVAMGANEATSVQNVRALNGVIGVLEQRAGKTLSAATTEVLTQVLNLVAAADEAIDEAQPLLAELMGVPNPDTDEADAGVETEAGETVQRAIVDETDLRAAIRGALCASDAAERDTIHKRAVELGREFLIPANWAEGRSFAGDEQRETYKDTLMALQCAVEDKLEGEFYSVWVQDFTDTDVIYCAGGDMCSAPYTLVPGGAVTIGDPVEVRPVTEYVAAETERSAAVVIPDFTSRAAQEYELLRLREARR